MIRLFSGLSARQFGKLVCQLRQEGADPAPRGQPWGLAFENRVLLVAVYWRTNLTMRQIAALFGTSKSAATASGVNHASRTATVIADGGYEE